MEPRNLGPLAICLLSSNCIFSNYIFSSKELRLKHVISNRLFLYLTTCQATDNHIHDCENRVTICWRSL